MLFAGWWLSGAGFVPRNGVLMSANNVAQLAQFTTMYNKTNHRDYVMRLQVSALVTTIRLTNGGVRCSFGSSAGPLHRRCANGRRSKPPASGVLVPANVAQHAQFFGSVKKVTSLEQVAATPLRGYGSTSQPLPAGLQWRVLEICSLRPHTTGAQRYSPRPAT